MNALTSIISSGEAFTNPLTPHIASAKSMFSMNGLTDENSPFYSLTRAAAFAQDPLTEYDGAKTALAATTFGSMESELDNLLAHTDRLSGVNMAGEGGLGNMAQIMGVARTVAGESSCDSFNSAFGAIAKAAAIISKILEIIQKIKDFLADPFALINNMIAALQGMAQDMINQIASDLLAFAEGKLLAIANALASALTGLIGDPCFAGIMKTVMTDKMSAEIDKIKKPEIPQLPRLQI